MTVNNDELLSALVDGELQGEVLERAIALLSTDSLARGRFQRYQLATNLLHGQAIRHQQGDITQQISDAIADEPSHSRNSAERGAVSSLGAPTSIAKVLTFPERFWKQAVGFAVAASFGALAVVGTLTQPSNPMVPSSTMAALEASVIDESSHRWTVTEQEIEDRLNVYLLDHNEYAGASNIFSNARVIAYESGR